MGFVKLSISSFNTVNACDLLLSLQIHSTVATARPEEVHFVMDGGGFGEQ